MDAHKWTPACAVCPTWLPLLSFGLLLGVPSSQESSSVRGDSTRAATPPPGETDSETLGVPLPASASPLGVPLPDFELLGVPLPLAELMTAGPGGERGSELSKGGRCVPLAALTPWAGGRLTTSASPLNPLITPPDPDPVRLAVPFTEAPAPFMDANSEYGESCDAPLIHGSPGRTSSTLH